MENEIEHRSCIPLAVVRGWTEQYCDKWRKSGVYSKTSWMKKIGCFSIKCMSFSGSKSRYEKPRQSALTGGRSKWSRAPAIMLLHQFSILRLSFLLKGTSRKQESKDISCCTAVVPNQKHIAFTLGLKPASQCFITWSPYSPCFAAPER